MHTYELLLDKIAPYLEQQFSIIPEDLQEKISLAGMGEKTEEIFLPGTEEFDYAYIERENKYFIDEEAREIEVGEGIKKGKGIRTKMKSESYYLWDRLSPLKREYKVARYDFDNKPGFRENAYVEPLQESKKSHLQKNFSELPQPIKMKIAFVDKSLGWNQMSTEQRECQAHFFDVIMQPDSAKKIYQARDWTLELLSIPNQIFDWEKKNPEGTASQQIIIDSEVRKLQIREAELEKLLDYLDSEAEQEFNQSKAVIGKSPGRPRSVEDNAIIIKQIIQILTEGEKIDPTRLPGKAEDLLDVCQQIAKIKSGKNMFSITLATFKIWLKATGYRFGNGRTPSDEAKYWTKLSVENIGKINPIIST